MNLKDLRNLEKTHQIEENLLFMHLKIGGLSFFDDKWIGLAALVSRLHQTTWMEVCRRASVVYIRHAAKGDFIHRKYKPLHGRKMTLNPQ